MDIKLENCEKVVTGWNILFKVDLSDDESSRCNLDLIRYIGDYNITKNGNVMFFDFTFDKGELKGDETINERLNLIEKDIENIVNTTIV